jgi:hypothetical protein
LDQQLTVRRKEEDMDTAMGQAALMDHRSEFPADYPVVGRHDIEIFIRHAQSLRCIIRNYSGMSGKDLWIWIW